MLARYRARVVEAQSAEEIAREIERTDSDPEGTGIMTRKGETLLVHLHRVSLKAAPLLKQELLAAGGESAHARGIADHTVQESPVLLVASRGQLQHLLPKLRRQPFRLGEIAEAIEAAVENYTRRSPRTLKGLHRSIPLGDRPRIMGVLNVTPDSFSDGGAFLDPSAAIAHAHRLIEEGADLLDVGAESTRPGAASVSAEEELRRLRPILAELHGFSPVPISVDTRKPEVARAALDLGADLVNDVSGLRNPAMRQLLARVGAPAIVMHMRGTPETMQDDTRYGDLRDEVYGALAEATATATQDGIDPSNLLVDPGLGFGKSPEQNFDLLAHLGEFRSLGYPIVVGASRKSFLGAPLGGATPTERAEPGLAAAVVAALEGAEVVRTHDVGPTRRALAFVEAVRKARRPHPPARAPA